MMAGCLGMIIAVVHGCLGEVKVVAAIREAPRSARRVMQAIMFLSAVWWFAGGLILVAIPWHGSADCGPMAALLIGAMYLSGALGNAWASRGRHIGWPLLLVATALAWGGALFSH